MIEWNRNATISDVRKAETMGMFDYVHYVGDCPSCGASIDKWQSKDGECSLSLLEPEDVRNFYGICPACDTWVHAKVAPARGVTVTLSTGRGR